MDMFIKSAVLEAGEKIMSLFGNAEILYSKDTVVDIVTEADLASNQIIVDAIKKNYPEHGIVSEEGDGHRPESEYQWYIDPVDGTKNFASHTPLFGINIALTHKGDITHAAIYLPYTKELIYAEKGLGVFLNDKPVRCSQKKEWAGSYGIGSVKTSPKYRNFLQEIEYITEGTGWISGVGSPAVSGLWIASGKRDWYMGAGSNSWDYVAAALIAEEAGCIVTNFEGGKYRPGDKGLVIANKYLHPELLEIVKKSYTN